MKKFLLLIIISFRVLTTTAQEINISDSVIYFDKTPVAYYVKEMNQTNPHYNVYIISMDKKMLIAALVTEFEAPVEELKPLYYYNLIFHNEKNERDTVAIYHEGQSFIPELVSLIKSYGLLKGNKINQDSLDLFKQKYEGNAQLIGKISEFETYLNSTRFFNEQVVRDRTKPVIIINENIIMQDGKKIGFITTRSSYPDATNWDNILDVSSNGNWTPYNYGDASIKTSTTNEYCLPNSRVISPGNTAVGLSKDKAAKQKIDELYNISAPLNKKLLNPGYLNYACELIVNYRL